MVNILRLKLILFRYNEKRIIDYEINDEDDLFNYLNEIYVGMGDEFFTNSKLWK